MDLLKKVIACKTNQEVDEIIKQELIKIDYNVRKMLQFGYLDNIEEKNVYRGFIPSGTHVEGLKDDDVHNKLNDTVFYQFSHLVCKMKMKNEVAFFHYLQYFLDNYYNKDKGNNSLKKTILAEQLLSLFGFDTYYCLGYLDNDSNVSNHPFNIVRRKMEYALIDYSMPVHSYEYNGKFERDYPFIGSMTLKEFDNFINSGEIKSFYDYKIIDGTVKNTLNKRIYSVSKIIDRHK